MGRGVFVLGTDTGVGKTFCSVLLIRALKKQGLKVSAMKPIASGSQQTAEGLRNNDALLLQKHANVELSYEQVNPYAYHDPISPHIAAEKEQNPFEIAVVKENFVEACSKSDIVLVEGVGGWRTPFSEKISSVDLVRELNIPVIMVVGLKLGCINHALLTAEALKRDQVNILGWIANDITGKNLARSETIETIARQVTMPLIANLSRLEFDDDGLLEVFDLSSLL